MCIKALCVCMVWSVQANPGVVSCQEGQLHGLETGDRVEFREVVGMEALNGNTYTVKGMYVYITHHLYQIHEHYTYGN